MKKIVIPVLLILLFISFTDIARTQWQWCSNGLGGGKIRNIAISKNKIFALTEIAGVYLTTDNGLNWSQVCCGMNYCMDITRTCNSVVAHDSLVLVLSGYGTYKWSDPDKCWGWAWIDAIGGGTCIVFSKNLIYEGSKREGLCKSSDNGLTWKMLGFINTYISSILVKDSLVLVSGTPNSVNKKIFAKSTDAGESWVTGLCPDNNLINSMINFNDTIYAATSGGGVIFSVDSANSWLPFNNGLSDSALYVNCITVRNKDFYIGTRDGLYILKENTNIWKKQRVGPDDNIVMDIQFNDSLIVVGTEHRGVYFSFDGGESWEARNNGFNIKTISSIVPKDNFLLAGTDDGFYISSDDGDSWTEKNNGLKNHQINSIKALGQDIYLATDSGIFISSDNGDKWFRRDTILNAKFINTIDNIDVNLFAGTNDGVYGSNDNGKTWVSIGLPEQNIVSIAINGTDIFCVSDFLMGLPDSVYYSSDYGGTWQNVIPVPFSRYTFIYHKGGDTLLLGTNIWGLYMSTDNGKNFNLICNLSSHATVVGVYGNYMIQYSGFYTNHIGYITSGWTGRVFSITGDEGKHWINMGLGGANIISFAFKDGYIFAGSMGYGIIRMKLSDLPSDVAESESNNFSLIYPNPASNYIKIDTKEPEFEVIIYDCLGQKVLQSKNTSNIDISNLNPGTYFYKIITKEKTEVKKFIKIK